MKQLTKKLKKKSIEPKNKNCKFCENKVLCDTKLEISNKLLVILDKKNKIPYLFDTGAKYSFIPKTMISTFKEDKLAPEILDVRGNKIKVLGYTTLMVNIGLQQDLPYKFYVVESSNPFATLGLNFIIENKLAINAKEKIITQAETAVKLKLEFSNPSCKNAIKTEVKKHLELLPEITKELSYKEKPKHTHFINVKLKNEVLPRHKKTVLANAITSKGKELGFLPKESIPKKKTIAITKAFIDRCHQPSKITQTK